MQVEDAEQRGDDVHLFTSTLLLLLGDPWQGEVDDFLHIHLPRVKCRTLLMNIHCHHCLFAELKSQFPEECVYP